MPTPDLRPVTNSAPYLCDFIPEAEFRRITGVRDPLRANMTGLPSDNGLCLAHRSTGNPPLGIHWDYDDGPQIIADHERDYADNSPHKLPADLGRGIALTGHVRPRTNYVIALFRCGKERPWMSIDFVPVVRGRDAVQDMVAFMRIAQQRFGEIHKCTPRPS
ncbi:hypothetical protein ACFQ07_32275 [Actinomadura adrarensis]|uniref:Uncharacterized protein n=1 Tax=Actinomadura adrarensis TaxID=1819600 RepID=A0ABW3CTS1_9ACTN